MSLQGVTDAVFAELQRARDLFGPVPQSADFTSTETLEAAHGELTASQAAAVREWKGESSHAYQHVAAIRAATLLRAIQADKTTAALLTRAVQAAQQGRQLVDGIIVDTHRGVADIAPATDTPAGQAALLAHLQTQLGRAQAVVDGASQQGATLADRISAAAMGYREIGATTGGGDVSSSPDDVIAGNGSTIQGRIQMIDNGAPSPAPEPPAPGTAPQIGPFPVPPSVAAATPPPPVTGEPHSIPPPPPRPVQVIDASPPKEPRLAPQVGFPKCATEDNVKHLAEILAGGLLFGASIPADIGSLGAATPGLAGGAWMVWDGADELRKCK
jgi:uncharacterized protein YukE